MNQCTMCATGNIMAGIPAHGVWKLKRVDAHTHTHAQTHTYTDSHARTHTQTHTHTCLSASSTQEEFTVYTVHVCSVFLTGQDHLPQYVQNMYKQHCDIAISSVHREFYNIILKNYTAHLATL